MVRHLESLRAHGEWADARLLRAVEAAAGDVSVALRELAHVRGAQEIWLARLDQRAPTMPVWPEWTIADLAQAGPVLDARLRTVFASLTPDGLEQTRSYTNTAGQAFTTPVAEILLHLMTHGQYHRGKANAALRHAGLPAVTVDYIVWQREMAGARATV